MLTRNACDTLGWQHAEGMASSERVEVVRTQPFLVFGFNSNQPFFTAEHVFFTTTGMRSLDPAAAMTQNPWLTVGRYGLGFRVEI